MHNAKMHRIFVVHQRTAYTQTYFYYSILECTLPDKWSFLKAYLHINGMDEVQMEGDGLCLINAICECVYMDYNIPLTKANLRKQVLQYLETHSQKYLQWYTGSKTDLIKQIDNFFQKKQYNTEAVDLFLGIVSEVLNLNIRIFQEQKSTGYIHIIQHINQKTENVINLKFSCNLQYSAENHYDNICKMDSNSTSSPVAIPESTKDIGIPPPQNDPIDLTLSPEKGNDCTTPIDLSWSPPPPTPPGYEDNDVEIVSDSETPTKEDIDEYLKKMHRGISFPFHLLKHVTEKEVVVLPDDIDGSQKYRIKCSVSNYTQLVRDRRWFQMSRSSVSDPQCIRRVGKCGGSLMCRNNSCSYLSTQGHRNTSKFMFSNGLRVCHSCGYCLTNTKCFARKLVEFREDEGYVHVAHIGVHTCCLKPNRKKYDARIRQEIENNTTLPPKKLKLKLIKEKVSEGDIEEAKEIAKILYDNRSVKTLRREILMAKDALPPNSIEAVAGIKETADKSDPMYIYKINSCSMNPDYPDFVFKTSKLMMEIAMQMDQSGPENTLQDEMCFFDGAHSRVTAFVALAAWVLHPSIY